MLSAIQTPRISKQTFQIFTNLKQLIQRRRLSIAVQKAYRQFSEQYPEWTNIRADSLFDEWFLSHHAAPLLARYTTNSTPPTATELAVAWDCQLGGFAKRRVQRIAEITPVLAEFLHLLEAELDIE